jgi:hypothetical protein
LELLSPLYADSFLAGQKNFPACCIDIYDGNFRQLAGKSSGERLSRLEDKTHAKPPDSRPLLQTGNRIFPSQFAKPVQLLDAAVRAGWGPIGESAREGAVSH